MPLASRENIQAAQSKVVKVVNDEPRLGSKNLLKFFPKDRSVGAWNSLDAKWRNGELWNKLGREEAFDVYES